jgi:hypothetical protein
MTFFKWFKRQSIVENVNDQDDTLTMPDYTIENAWRDHFAPVARELGFKGAGRHFRRVIGCYVHTLNLQGSQYGGKFAVNLGLQPLDAPDVLGRDVNPKTVKEIECLFRNRLTIDGCDTWWSYAENAETKIEAVKSAASLLRNDVDDYFYERIQFFENVTSEEIGRVAPDVYVALALLREKQHELLEAQKFAKLAVERSSPKYWKKHSPVRHLVTD